MNQGDLFGKETVFMLPVRSRRAERTGVRAPVVAMKSRNGDGAKGAQEGGYVTDRTAENRPAGVPEKAKQAGEIRDRWDWVEPSVWTERMLTALEEGVKGGKWFSLMDKVYAMPNLRSAFKKVKANRGKAGIDHQTIEMFESHLEENLERISKSLKEGNYRPQAIKRVWIPKPGSKEKRPLGIPTVRDRVVQTALLNVLEPIFERDFAEQSYGFRPERGCKDALRRVTDLLLRGKNLGRRRGSEKLFRYDSACFADSKSGGESIGRCGDRNLETYLKQNVMEAMEQWTPGRGNSPRGHYQSNAFEHLSGPAGP